MTKQEREMEIPVSVFKKKTKICMDEEDKESNRRRKQRWAMVTYVTHPRTWEMSRTGICRQESMVSLS
jgi:hypothetical protein